MGRKKAEKMGKKGEERGVRIKVVKKKQGVKKR